jgi:hypothetical protein
VQNSWDPIGVPQAGDQVVIAGPGGPSISSVDPKLDDLHVTLGGTDFAQPASISASGATFGSGFAVTVLPNSPYAALSFDGSTTFDGTLSVVGGQLSVTTGTELQGSGQTFIEKGATVTFNGTMPPTQTVSFGDPNGTLVLIQSTTFGARITGVQPGDRIELGRLYIAVSASYADGKLTITGEGGAVIATLNLVEAVSPMSFYASLSGDRGSTLSTSQRRCSWNGGTGDWYDATLWTGGVPLGGDTVSIPSGTVILSEADASSYGTLDAESITLGTDGSSEAVVLEMSNASFGPAAFITTRGNPQYAPHYIQPLVTLLASGTTMFDATVFHEAQGGKLTIVSHQSDGSSGNFIITGNPPAHAKLDTAPFATIFVGQESRLEFTGGTFTNNGLVLINGNAEIGRGVVFQGAGTIQMEAGGSVSVLGAVSAEQSFVFSDDKGTLSLGNLPEFKAKVDVARKGNKIRLPNLQAQSLSYDQQTQILVLKDGDGKQVGEVRITDPNGDGTGDFTLKSDGNGSAITYTPLGAVTLMASLPVAAVGTTGALIKMKTLLTQAFGGVPAGYASYTLSGPFRQMPNESYWDQPPRATPTNSRWYYDYQPITVPITVPASDLDRVLFFVGNSIVWTAYFTVPVALDAAGNPTEYVQYNIWTVDPSVDAPETAYPMPHPNVPGSGRRFGRPDPSDIVSSAYRYNTVYSGVLNYNNCNWISDNVTAGAGAVQPWDNASTDPADNVSGGFWRIVYRGSDTPEPVRDWFTLTQPGDVVRMGHLDSNGMHTTTVVGTINPDGSIMVYDNGDKKPGKPNTIGAHAATYWTGTDPATITIYRLDGRAAAKTPSLPGPATTRYRILARTWTASR